MANKRTGSKIGVVIVKNNQESDIVSPVSEDANETSERSSGGNIPQHKMFFSTGMTAREMAKVIVKEAKRRFPEEKS